MMLLSRRCVSSLLLLLSVVLVASHDDCSVSHLRSQLLEEDDHRMEKYKQNRRHLTSIAQRPEDESSGEGFWDFFATLFGFGCRECIDVEVIFHIVTNDDGSSEDTHKWTNQAIDLQLDKLNEFYGDTRFRFRLRKVTRTKNTLWANTPITNENVTDEMLEALHEGGSDVANVFVTDGCCETTAGWAQFPWERGFTPSNEYYADDRVHLCSTYLNEPDRDIVAYSTLLAHEMGHWFGLMHTFQGRNCDPDNKNDRVDDTPQHEEGPDSGCPIDQDSCPNLEGLDPVTNFMNNPGKCRSTFTEGQIDRMYAQFNEYRRRIGPCLEAEETEAIFEVRFDGKPSENEISYAEYYADGNRDWTDLKTLEDDEVFDYAHQTFSRQVCLIRDLMYSFTVRDLNEDGFDAPGYMSLRLNGRQVLYEHEFNTEWNSAFVLTQGKCASGQISLGLDIDFGSSSDGLSWQVQNTNTTAMVMTRELSATYTDQAYRRLYFEQCVDSGDDGVEYELTIYDEDGGDGPDKYQIYVGDDVVHVGGDGFDAEESVLFVATSSASLVPTMGVALLPFLVSGWAVLSSC